MTRRTAMVFLVLAAVTLTACGGGSDTATAPALRTVDAGTAAEVLDEGQAVLLDIRTPEEFDAGKIAGSVNIDYYADDFAALLDDLDKDATYVVYCRSGNRSGASMEIFADLGFESIYEIDGGIVEWDAAGLPIVP